MGVGDPPRPGAHRSTTRSERQQETDSECQATFEALAESRVAAQPAGAGPRGFGLADLTALNDWLAGARRPTAGQATELSGQRCAVQRRTHVPRRFAAMQMQGPLPLWSCSSNPMSTTSKSKYSMAARTSDRVIQALLAAEPPQNPL